MTIDMNLATGVSSAAGLEPEDRDTVRELVDLWRRKRPRICVSVNLVRCTVMRSPGSSTD